jgi:hypothetical protein
VSRIWSRADLVPIDVVLRHSSPIASETRGIYGEGWHRGSRDSATPIVEKVQSLGFGCALLSHRLGPKDKYPAQVEDVATAFAWMKRPIAEKGGNRERVFPVAHVGSAFETGQREPLEANTDTGTIISSREIPPCAYIWV